ncbi:MAG: T9SS type A sorting domain-containing protein [Winogradskyella sp.]|nr:MAG: T9SS type A sorting domain-containing protein [Winogradskyella sp.]
MKKQILLFSLLISQMFNAQTVLLQESFETDGEGSRYTSNTFYLSTIDFFTRMDNNPTMYAVGNNAGSHPTNPDGSFYWGAEDCDQASGGEGVITLNAFAVTGYTTDVDVFLSNARPNDFRLETTDYFILEYNMDGAGWTIFGAMYGNNGAGNGNLQIDANLDGSPDSGGAEVNSSDFQNFNFSIPVTGNNLQIRFRVLASTASESIIFDNIRLNGTTTLGIDNNALFNNVSIYPNPSNGLVNINLDELEDTTIKAYNTLGQLVYVKKNVTSQFHHFELDKSSGLYFIEISSQNNKQTYKLVIK